MSLNLDNIITALAGTEIEPYAIDEHPKASESYIDVRFLKNEEIIWDGRIPYQYRRTGLFLETEDEIVKYLKLIKPYFVPAVRKKWIKEELKAWKNKGGDVTTKFFKKLASLEWVDADVFPNNPNPQRRIQDIKEMGYTLATKKNGRKFQRLLVPIPKGPAQGYEVFSPKFKALAIKTLDALNVYELSSANKGSLIPDHKFPEIRWDTETKAENPETMTEAEIKEKFQLLDNQRNQQKREVCRKCFQTSKRGFPFGIRFFYKGDQNWPSNVPTTGKSAEQGCVGCGWYDLEKWRKALNDLIASKS